MSNIYEQKKLLRKHIRAQVRALSAADAQAQAQNVWQQIEALPQFQQAQRVLTFWSLPDEVSSHSFITRWSEHKTILLPVMVDQGLEVRRFNGLSSLSAQNAFGVAEPIASELVAPAEVEFAIIPGMAFDPLGHRLGRGKGYYDRLLPLLLRAHTVGVGYACQLVAAIPTEPHDIAVKQVVTG